MQRQSHFNFNWTHIMICVQLLWVSSTPFNGYGDDRLHTFYVHAYTLFDRLTLSTVLFSQLHSRIISIISSDFCPSVSHISVQTVRKWKAYVNIDVNELWIFLVEILLYWTTENGISLKWKRGKWRWTMMCKIINILSADENMLNHLLQHVTKPLHLSVCEWQIYLQPGWINAQNECWTKWIWILARIDNVIVGNWVNLKLKIILSVCWNFITCILTESQLHKCLLICFMRKSKVH